MLIINCLQVYLIIKINGIFLDKVEKKLSLCKDNVPLC